MKRNGGEQAARGVGVIADDQIRIGQFEKARKAGKRRCERRLLRNRIAVGIEIHEIADDKTAVLLPELFSGSPGLRVESKRT